MWLAGDFSRMILQTNLKSRNLNSPTKDRAIIDFFMTTNRSRNEIQSRGTKILERNMWPQGDRA